MGQAGLGYSFDSLQENSSNEFARALNGLLCVPPSLPAYPSCLSSSPLSV